MAKPCLGYSSRTEAIIALRSKGLSTREIAERTGLDVNIITALEHSGARSKRRAFRPEAEQTRAVLFPPVVLDRLGPHAARRGVAVQSLARRIVETALTEGLIDALLDDAEEVN